MILKTFHEYSFLQYKHSKLNIKFTNKKKTIVKLNQAIGSL